MAPINVFARWRPLTETETASNEVEIPRQSISSPNSRLKISLTRASSLTDKDKTWTSPAAFLNVFEPEADNAEVYKTIVAPSIATVLSGKSCSFFAYGHSGSGKTHTIIGYDYGDDPDNDKRLGICLIAAKELFAALQPLNEGHPGNEFAIGFSLFELRRKMAYDLLNGKSECHVREGPDGRTHIRGETETLEGGKVRVRPIVKRACWDYEMLVANLKEALGHRAVGSSSVHDQSSRTHAVLEFEVINRELVAARDELIERQSELVPVGKRATDISIEEQTKGFIRTADGGWIPNPAYRVNEERISAANKEKGEFEARVAIAEDKIAAVFASARAPCLGGKMVFVDLAGAEYHQEKGVQLASLPRQQTPQEKLEGRQINSDLLALKEVMRAWAENRPRIPFRSSTLTMVLREHFVGADPASSAVIVTVSPAEGQYAATLNSLKYASLVGV